jgi:hypothetical protein
LGQRDHRGFVFGPVVKRCRIEVGAARLHQCVNLAIEFDRVELLEVAQRAEELAFEDWSKIDGPYEPIPELDAEPVWACDLKRLDRVDWVSQASLLPQRLRLPWLALPGGVPSSSQCESVGCSSVKSCVGDSVDDFRLHNGMEFLVNDIGPNVVLFDGSRNDKMVGSQ